MRYDLRFWFDQASAQFVGECQLELSTTEATRNVVLHAVGLVVEEGDDVASVAYDSARQTATLRLAADLTPGTSRLKLRWTGSIATELRGVFSSWKNGQRYITTHCQPADARRIFPCFDDPALKARFAVRVVHDAQLTAISNAAVSAIRSVGDGTVETAFLPTEVISTYLFSLALGPYCATSTGMSKSGVECRAWSPPGTIGMMAARDIHVQVLDYLESYLGSSYPFGGKLDAIAVPELGPGAMENPGAIMYRSEILSANAATANTAFSSRKASFAIIAHELTHMWWGNLVTMDWWDDLWLNEAFASLIGDKCTCALNSDWLFERDFMVHVAGAFAADARVHSRPVAAPVENESQANQRFDETTYTKGQAVLAMFEAYVGESKFRRGVQRFLALHSWSSVCADDFWRALSTESGEDVASLANPWIRLPGHPLVKCRVAESKTGLVVELEQSAFGVEEGSLDGRLWPIPMRIRYGTLGGGIETKRFLFDNSRASFELPNAVWFYPNGDASGFYRVALDVRSLQALLPWLESLSTKEKISFLDNQWALARHGDIAVADVLRSIRAMSLCGDLYVLRMGAEVLGWISGRVVGTDIREPIAALVEGIFRPLLVDLGWDCQEHESSDRREVRRLAIGCLGHIAMSRDVIVEARRRVEAHLDGAVPLDGELGETIWALGAIDGDSVLYDRYLARLAECRATDAPEEAWIRNGLADFRGRELVERTLIDVFCGETRAHDRPVLLTRLLSRRHARDIAWSILKAKWDSWVRPLEPRLRQQVVTAFAMAAATDGLADVADFLEALNDEEIDEVVLKVVERVRANTVVVSRFSSDLAGLGSSL